MPKLMIIYLKNIICKHTKWELIEEFKMIGIVDVKVNLFEIEFKGDPSHKKIEEIKVILQKFNIELSRDLNESLVEKIKYTIIKMIRTNSNLKKLKHSVYLSEKIGMSYDRMSKIFSKVAETTIEHFFIEQRIEWDKEALEYEDAKISQISINHGYNSLAHFTRVFTQHVRITPSEYRDRVRKK